LNLSITKIGMFFLTIFMLAWFLYPREFFLGYIYEGREELQKAEKQYSKYLENHPNSKFATLRLIEIYKKMAKPIKATLLYNNLYEHRSRDWNIAQKYLSHLEENHEYKLLLNTRLKMAQNFMNIPRFPQERVENLLALALERTLWDQDHDMAYDILVKLTKVSKRPMGYIEQMTLLDKSLKKTGRVLKTLEKRLKENPNDLQIKEELVSIYLIVGKHKKSLKILNDLLKTRPNDKGLINLKVTLYTKQKQYKSAISEIKKLQGFKNTAKEKTALLETLANLYNKNKQHDLALATYQELLKNNKNSQQYWLSIIYLLSDDKKIDESIATLTDYLKIFDDFERKKMLADLYLYEKKEINMPLFVDYIKEDADQNFALDVAYHLISKDDTVTAKTWLETIQPLFSYNKEVLSLLIDIYLNEDDFKNSLKIALKLYKLSPNDVELIQTVAQIYQLTQDHENAEIYYERLAALNPNNFDTLKIVGRELHYMGRPKKALYYLRQAMLMQKTDPETWFLISDSMYAQGEFAKSKHAALQVLKLTESKNNLPLPLAKMVLKSKGRVAFNQEVVADYNGVIGMYPKDQDLRIDFIDLLLEKRQAKLSGKQIDTFLRDFPTQAKRLKTFQFRLAVLNKNWKRSIKIGKELRNTTNDSWYVRRDMAEAYKNIGDWKSAVYEFEQIYAATGDELYTEYPLQKLRDEHNHSVTAGYEYFDFGADNFMNWNAKYSGHITRNLKLGTDFIVGYHNASSVNYSSPSFEGMASLSSYHIPYFIIGGGAGAAFNDQRKTPTFNLNTTYYRGQNLRLSANIDYRKLRTDIPQAVAAGALYDTASFNYNYIPIERLILSGEYKASRSYLPGGASSVSQNVEPGLAYVIFKEPYFNLGYQFVLNHNSNNNSFFTQVPLVSDSKVHYLTGFISHNIKNKLTLEGGFYIGEDTERDLHLFKGDLFGGSTNVTWRVNPWLKVNSSYQFSRESLASISGESHHLNFSITGNWDQISKKLPF
jgi:tetratricopeptide (TPR) repeat protein